MASYSEMASRWGAKAFSQPALDRTKTVRFHFNEHMPESSDFRTALFKIVASENIKGIQSLPRNKVDVTLEYDDDVTDLLYRGLTLNGKSIQPRAIGFPVSLVYVRYLPLELSSDRVDETLCEYGRVINIERQMYKDTAIQTGTRVITMEIKRSIPSFLPIDGFRAKLWHRDQVQTCAACASPEHFIKDCPNRREYRAPETAPQPTEPEITVTQEEPTTITEEPNTTEPLTQDNEPAQQQRTQDNDMVSDSNPSSSEGSESGEFSGSDSDGPESPLSDVAELVGVDKSPDEDEDEQPQPPPPTPPPIPDGKTGLKRCLIPSSPRKKNKKVVVKKRDKDKDTKQ